MKKTLITAAVCLISLSGLAQGTIHSITDFNLKSAPLNSHVAQIDRCSLEPDFRTKVVLGENELGQQMLDYGRIKRLQDGTYVMFYQPLRVGYHIYVSFSKDCINWTKGERVFVGRKFTNGDGEEDKWKYATADAVQLANGDILVFCIFHSEKHYAKHLDEFGVAFKRSSDGGHSWSEERVLYNTVNWEPYPMVLDDGEILVFFTDSDWDWNPNSSGSSLLRSKDNGETWTLQKQAIRQVKGKAQVKQRSVGTPRLSPDSTRIVFTDQMPVVCKLNCSDQSLAVLESAHMEEGLSISLAWEDSHWPTTLTGEMTGPAKRRNNAFEGSGPYVMQFPSGETAVTYGSGDGFFACRVGNETGWNLPERDEFFPFGRTRGRWGSIERMDAHTAVVVTTDPYKGFDVEKAHLKIVQMRLNHAVDAPELAVSTDGKALEWSPVDDALFLGSGSQAQCTFRFAHDGNKLYVLAECLDSEPSDEDGLTLMFSDGQDRHRTKYAFCDLVGKKVKVAKTPGVSGSGFSVKGEGYVAEFAVSLSELPVKDGELYFNAVMYKKDFQDCFTNIGASHVEQFIPIRLK